MTDPKSIRLDFYNRLADAAGIRRLWRVQRSGLAIPNAKGGKATVRVDAYSGDFKDPDRYGQPVPRITVSLRGPYTFPDLELSVALEELPLWAPWVAAWVKGEPLPAATPVAKPWQGSDLGRADYLWSAKGNEWPWGVGRCPMCGAPSPHSAGPPPGE
jgi:hypothetical protein